MRINNHFTVLSLLIIGLLVNAQHAVGWADEKPKFPKLRAFVKKHQASMYASDSPRRKLVSVEFYDDNLSDAVLRELKPLLDDTGFPVRLYVSGKKVVTPALLSKLTAIQNLVDLTFSQPETTNDDVKSLSKMVSLKRLSIRSRKTTSDAYAHISNLVNLEQVWISQGGSSYSDQFNDASLRHMTKLINLKSIRVGGDGLTDHGLSYLKGLYNLESIIISSASVSKAGLRHLAKLPKLKTMDIYDCPTINYDGLEGLADWPQLEVLSITLEGPFSHEAAKIISKLSKLKKLTLQGEIGDALDGLKNHPSLESVQLYNAKVSSSGLKYLSGMSKLKYLMLEENDLDEITGQALSGLPSLERLSLTSSKIDDSSLKVIGKLTSLKHLGLSQNKIIGTGLAELAGLHDLKYLELSGNPIKTLDVGALAKLRGLTTVYFTGTKLSDDVLIDLKKAMPKTTIYDYARDEVVLEKKDPFPDLKEIDISKRAVDHVLPPKKFFPESEKERAELKKLKGKVIQVTGMISNFGRDPELGYSIGIQTNERGNFIEFFVGRQRLWIDYSRKQTVTLKGLAVESYGTVWLDHCLVTKAEKDPSLAITSNELSKAFSNDAEATKEKFGGKPLKVTGKVKTLTFDTNGVANVVLDGTVGKTLNFKFSSYKASVKKYMRPGMTTTIKCEGPRWINSKSESIDFGNCYPSK